MAQQIKPKKQRKKIAYAGKEAKSYVQEPTAITLPNEKVLVRFKKDLDLSDIGFRNLILILCHVKEDLNAMASIKRSAQERKALIKQLKKFEQNLRKLRNHCERYAHMMDIIVPGDSRAFMGQVLTFSAMSDLLGKNMIPAHAARLMAQGFQDIAACEDALSDSREAIGLNYGGSFFMKMIQRLHEPFKLWIENHAKLNTNSGHQRVARNHLLYWLIYEAEAILGPGARQNPGQLVRLCREIAAACGLDEQGFDSAVRRIMRQIKQEKADRQFAQAEPVTSSVN